LFSDCRAYGTVELLVLVAVLGVLATALMATLNSRVSSSSTTVGNQIDTLVDN
jgi:type II secretory pathway pseudopilin PulG